MVQEFTENLEDAETLVPAQVSQNSDSERPTNVVSKSRKLNIDTRFPKDRNCEVCLRTKMTRAPRRRRTGDAVLRAEKFGDLLTKSLTREVNLETITDTLSWYKI